MSHHHPCCRVASHPNRAQIDARLASGESPLKIALEAKVAKSIMYRHRDKHLHRSLLRAADAAQVAQADGLMAQVQALMAEAQQLQETATRKGDVRAAVQALRARLEHLELLAKLSGELTPKMQPASVTNILNIFDEKTQVQMLRTGLERRGFKVLEGECAVTE